MQRNIFLIGLVIFILLFIGVVLFKKRITPSVPPPTTSSTTPTQIPNTSPTQIPTESNITVTSPKANEIVKFPFFITGQARVFENQLSYRITDEKGVTLSSGNTMANSPDMGQFGPYTITIKDLGEFDSGNIRIEVFQNSARDGSEIDKVTVSVTLQ